MNTFFFSFSIHVSDDRARARGLIFSLSFPFLSWRDAVFKQQQMHGVHARAIKIESKFKCERKRKRKNEERKKEGSFVYV
jgi:hypothetical protein